MSTATLEAQQKHAETRLTPMIVANTEPLEARITALKQEKLWHTPPVSTPIVWYDRCDVRPEQQVSAQVTKIEQPGVISCIVFRVGRMPEHKNGVRHITHPIHDMPNNVTTQRNGGWDYPDDVKAPDHHKAFHRADRDRRLAAAERALEEAQAINEKQFPSMDPEQ